jgi:hypothetical protein
LGFVVATEPTARDLAKEVERIDAFLRGYTTHPEFFEDGWPILIVLLVCANDDETGIEILFSCEGPSDPHLRSLCESAIAALVQAYPERGFDFTWELVSGQ